MIKSFHKRIAYIALVFVLCMVSSGCRTAADYGGAPQDNGATPGDLGVGVTAGDQFLAAGYKIKTVITPQTVSTFDQLVFEVYVDGKGNGTGLVGYKEKVYDVIISADKIYIKVAGNVAVQINDFSGHIIPSSVTVAGVSDLTSIGFGLLDGAVSSYKSSNQQFIIDGTYQLSEATFDATTIVAGNVMSMNELINYILSIENTSYLSGAHDITPNDAPEVTTSVIPDKGSFWNNSTLGVTINKKIYSIGDYCNPSTYFDGVTPETLSPTYTYNMDRKVEVMHITYQSSDGRTAFQTTEGYVQAISTSSDFTFLGISKGMSQEDLRAVLGINLKKAEQDTFKPLLPGMTSKLGKKNSIDCQYGDLEFHFYIGKDKSLESLTIMRPIEFD